MFRLDRVSGGVVCIELFHYFEDHSYSSSVKVQISSENRLLLPPPPTPH